MVATRRIIFLDGSALLDIRQECQELRENEPVVVSGDKDSTRERGTWPAKGGDRVNIQAPLCSIL